MDTPVKLAVHHKMMRVVPPCLLTILVLCEQRGRHIYLSTVASSYTPRKMHACTTISSVVLGSSIVA
jgi:hypothetical protein